MTTSVNQSNPPARPSRQHDSDYIHGSRLRPCLPVSWNPTRIFKFKSRDRQGNMGLHPHQNSRGSESSYFIFSSILPSIKMTHDKFRKSLPAPKREALRIQLRALPTKYKQMMPQ
jgi:hypothetical protein